MNTIIFLIVWLATEAPTAQFLTSFESVKECEIVKARIEAGTPAAKGKLACLQVVAQPNRDAGTTI